MTDVRKCDGPECNEFALLNNDDRRELADADPEAFITVEKNKGQDKTVHFHNWICLKKWSDLKIKPQL